MVATREQAFAMRLPAANDRLAEVDVATINDRRDRLAARLDAAVKTRDIHALATEQERGWIEMLDGVDAELARQAGDTSLDDAREKARLARGVLLWRLDAAWKVRTWQANRALRDLNASVYDARTRETASSRARGGAPERNAVLGGRVKQVSPRVVALAARVDAARAAQAARLAQIAIGELEAQRRRLDEYSVQARFALATIYDRATAGVSPKASPASSPIPAGSSQ
jgi:hypothetical protein